MALFYKKIKEAIEQSDRPQEVKDLLLRLLNYELRSQGDGYSHYAKHYDRELKEIVSKRNSTEEQKQLCD